MHRSKPLRWSGVSPLSIAAPTMYVVSVNSANFYPFESDLPVTNGNLTEIHSPFIPSPGAFPAFMTSLSAGEHARSRVRALPLTRRT